MNRREPGICHLCKNYHVVMGLFSKGRKNPPERQKTGEINTYATGTPPPPLAEPLVAIRLKSGRGITLEVNTQHIADEVVRELLGRPREDEIERSVRGWMMRDTTSQYPDSVRIETSERNLIGWVIKAQSYYACELIHQVSQAMGQADKSVKGRGAACEVSLWVEGSWDKDEEIDPDTGKPYGWTGDVHTVEVRIAAPVALEAVPNK